MSSNIPAVFTPEAVAAINRAYAEACDILGSERNQRHLRPKLAEHMMDLARSGELNEGRLCSLSVLAVLGRPPAPLVHRRTTDEAASHGAGVAQQGP